MNTGAFGIIGIGVFLLIVGYSTESAAFILIGAVILLGGFCLLTVKPQAKNPTSNQPFFRCPNCSAMAGEEIPKEKREDGKVYKCKVCDYKW